MASSQLSPLDSRGACASWAKLTDGKAKAPIATMAMLASRRVGEEMWVAAERFKEFMVDQLAHCGVRLSRES
jgi:hypothetical protein